ncbi:helix-turn-helix transcriptional regulator [Flavobacteriaceae bacterium TP-CH-4]|uniref:Helix-turn-helix transcriptional regulator n=2 Tax=Pelagihabitans pacificus TaxID=2696054 RepID=A0A967APL5_9FLAO|nr:helix-turn-helix transcriptional regulator [Pelagihabitans pacificus]
MICVYQIETDHFLHCNSRFKTLIGPDCDRLIEEGWRFWLSRIDPKESLWIRNSIFDYFALPFTRNPLTLRYHMTNSDAKRVCIKHEMHLHKMERQTLSLNYFFDVTDKERIEQYFELSEKVDNPLFSNEQSLHISTREKEVLRLIANGFSSKEIADMLFISNHTAISHRKNLIEKFQVKNTAHLIKKAAAFICL